MNVADFFKGIGHALGGAFGLVKKLVPEAQLLAGIEYAKEAAQKFGDNALKHKYVRDLLVSKFHVPGYVADLTISLAVAKLHELEEAAAAKASGAVADPTPAG